MTEMRASLKIPRDVTARVVIEVLNRNGEPDGTRGHDLRETVKRDGMLARVAHQAGLAGGGRVLFVPEPRRNFPRHRTRLLRRAGLGILKTMTGW